MNSTEPGSLTDVIWQLQQVGQKVVFVQEAILSPPEPVLAHLSALKNFLMETYSEHLDSVQWALRVTTEEAIERLEDEIDNFEALFKEVSRAVARKHVAAARTSAPPSSAADQLAAEAWLKQQLDAWESLKVDVPELINGIEEAMPLNQGSENVVVEAPSEFGTDSFKLCNVIQPTSDDSLPREISDSTDVASRRPQRTTAEFNTSADPVDHPASTESRKDVADSAWRDQLQLVTNPCLDHAEGGSKMKPGPDLARIPATSKQSRPDRVHPDSGHEVKSIEECNPQLPSMVKAPDKRGHSCSCRFHPDYGAKSRNDLSGQCVHPQQSHELQCRAWHPTVPLDKTAPTKARKIYFPDKQEDFVELPQPGGGCSVLPKMKPHLRTRPRTLLCAPCFDSELLPLRCRYCRNCQPKLAKRRAHRAQKRTRQDVEATTRAAAEK